VELGLRGRTALVTGASRGIGKAIALGLAAEGCDLVLAATDPQRLDATAAEIRAAHGVTVIGYAGDLTKPADIATLAERGAQADILVNNAGAVRSGHLRDIDAATWRTGWELKVFAYIELARALHPFMAARGRGVIVNVIGLAGERPSAATICVSTANAALMMFTSCLAGEAPAAVRVVGVNPGPIVSDRFLNNARRSASEKLGDPERWPELFTGLPVKRPGKVEEVADVVAFLASDRAAHVNGVVLRVDAGLKPITAAGGYS
jgi:3-oxoacyl-[acyl-carrier protein] reductase